MIMCGKKGRGEKAALFEMVIALQRWPFNIRNLLYETCFALLDNGQIMNGIWFRTVM